VKQTPAARQGFFVGDRGGECENRGQSVWLIHPGTLITAWRILFSGKEKHFLREEETSSQAAVFGEGRSGLRVKGMLQPLTVKD
jgi:hypothetical protein